MRRLVGRIAIVTGAGQGIGYAVARRLSDEGATVVAAHRSAQTGDALIAEIVASGGDARFVQTDVSHPDDVHQLITQTQDELGKVDIVCNNAGIDLNRAIIETSINEFDNVMAVNVRGVFLMCRAAIASMRETGGGSIINIASVAGLVGLPGSAAYAASKGAVLSLTRQLAREYALDKIRVNSVCPGSVDTARLDDFLAGQPNRAEALSSVEALNPMRRVGKPTEIAAAVAFLASADASFITGATVVVDGGLVIQ